MKLNQLVSQRFEKLADWAVAIDAAKTLELVGRESGTHYCSINQEDFADWAGSVLDLLRRVFGEDSAHFQNFSHDAANVGKSEYLFRGAVAIFDVARDDYEGGYLHKLQSTVTAEVLGDVLEQAKGLSSGGYTGPACVVAGVALDTTLKDLCARHGIAHDRLDRMNAALAKKNVYSKATKKQIAVWADRRDAAVRGDLNGDTGADVDEMINGVALLIADHV